LAFVVMDGGWYGPERHSTPSDGVISGNGETEGQAMN